MIFINSTVQNAFFDLICKRRGKRREYGAITHTTIGKRAQFDRCLIIIVSHHPHIWSYGTGNLLIAPPAPKTLSKASTRAIEWRLESVKEHDSNGIINKGFGYYIRYTLECRERMSIYMNTSDKDCDLILKMFEYVDCMAAQLYDLISNIKIVCHRRNVRYGDYNFNEGNLTNNKSNYDIMLESNLRPDIKALREFIVDVINPESVTYTISRLVIPSALLYADKEEECVVCLQEKKVLVWPCHTSHVTCTECTIELSSRLVSCPLCRESLLYHCGKWYSRNQISDLL